MTFKKSFQSMFLDAALRIYMKSEGNCQRLRSNVCPRFHEYKNTQIAEYQIFLLRFNLLIVEE